jgi:phage terminase Nu1 subunit (DNA packaging protein)
MAPRLNRADTAEAMGVNVTTIDRWVKEGCPVAQRGSRGVEWAFDLPALIRWWGDRRAADAEADAPDDLLEIEKRTKQAAMFKAELELAKARGEVASVREFELAQSRAMAAIRARVMNVPQRVVTQLLGETDATKFKDKLKGELREALEQAADEDITLEDDDGDDGSA